MVISDYTLITSMTFSVQVIPNYLYNDIIVFRCAVKSKGWCNLQLQESFDYAKVESFNYYCIIWLLKWHFFNYYTRNNECYYFNNTIISLPEATYLQIAFAFLFSWWGLEFPVKSITVMWIEDIYKAPTY